MAHPNKILWQGTVICVQPRIRLTRSFDESQHSYLGYVLLIDGVTGSEERQFSVAVGKGAHSKHLFRKGDVVAGSSLPVADPRLELAELYKTSGIKLLERDPEEHDPSGPPFVRVPPELELYRERRHRRLSARSYTGKCGPCIWGCRMPVEMIIDHWNPRVRRYRFETFCYGPKSCPLYKPGPKRKVPGRKGMVHVEEDWEDEEATSHRGPDD